MISALCDWIKEQQFLKLKDEINNDVQIVYRGAHGTTLEIKVRELVVGDVVALHQGDRIPADCIILEEMNMRVDETMYHPHE